ncbi:MAG: SRPBCC family protein [Polaromonas sp.]|nr:SRPBCC family protein [Polaromonas sp.]
MQGGLKTRFADRWLWLCPVLSILLAAVVLMLFGFTFWGALLAALLLVCPAMILWGAIEVMLDERHQRAARNRQCIAPATAPVVSPLFRFHREAAAAIAASPQAVFAFLDDHRRLTAHMEKPSLMTAGATMKIETDSQQGQAVGSLIRMNGRILGISLCVEETVSEYRPPFRKTWETRGEPRLLVIGGYRMGFELTPKASKTHLRVWIDYNLPSGIPERWLGRILGDAYANWCVTRMVRDAARAF